MLNINLEFNCGLISEAVTQATVWKGVERSHRHPMFSAITKEGNLWGKIEKACSWIGQTFTALQGG